MIQAQHLHPALQKPILDLAHLQIPDDLYVLHQQLRLNVPAFTGKACLGCSAGGGLKSDRHRRMNISCKSQPVLNLKYG